MQQHIQRIYRQLCYWGLVSSQNEFSTRWLGQCPSYLSSIKARGIEPNTEAALTLLARMRRHRDYPNQTELPRTSNQLGQLSRMLEMEADAIAEQLFEASLLRVAARHSLSQGEFS